MLLSAVGAENDVFGPVYLRASFRSSSLLRQSLVAFTTGTAVIQPVFLEPQRGTLHETTERRAYSGPRLICATGTNKYCHVSSSVQLKGLFSRKWPLVTRIHGGFGRREIEDKSLAGIVVSKPGGATVTLSRSSCPPPL